MNAAMRRTVPSALTHSLSSSATASMPAALRWVPSAFKGVPLHTPTQNSTPVEYQVVPKISAATSFRSAAAAAMIWPTNVLGYP